MRHINSKTLAPAAGPFSTAVSVNGFLFLSGQVGTDQSGKLKASFNEEVIQVMQNIGFVLRHAGLDYKDVATVTIYLKDMKNFKPLNEIYSSYFNGTYPARTCIAVADLPVNANVEMTVTAVLNETA
jgi:2-iminobutanoate/2-iminopropanoate deaminase